MSRRIFSGSQALFFIRLTPNSKHHLLTTPHLWKTEQLDSLTLDIAAYHSLTAYHSLQISFLLLSFSLSSRSFASLKQFWSKIKKCHYDIWAKGFRQRLINERLISKRQGRDSPSSSKTVFSSSRAFHLKITNTKLRKLSFNVGEYRPWFTQLSWHI